MADPTTSSPVSASVIKNLFPAGTSAETKEKVLTNALTIAFPVVMQHFENPSAAMGDGKFLEMLMELLKILIPILLELFT